MNSINLKLGLPAEEACCGCEGCCNICPVNAISMREDADGFLMPVIEASTCVNCGKCASVCPVAGEPQPAGPIPPCYAFRADDDTRQHSSSGGVFTVLAKWMLGLGGHVCGAVYDDEFNIRHILARSWEDVAAMRGSKYAQSNIGHIYREIEVILKKGIPVLFSGTPCQCAALKSFLGQTYDNLYIVDIICHGVPPQAMLRKYIRETARGRQLAGIRFRDKRYGWHATTLRLEFTDGSVNEGDCKSDPYQRNFYENVILRKSCEICGFSSFPRQGDLSMGDFWGYAKVKGGDTESGGTSLVLVNNAKGSKLLEALKSNGNLLRRIDCNPSKLPNRVNPRIYFHPVRDRFFELAKSMTFAEAADFCHRQYFDVGIVGPWRNHNVGGFLTYFALYHVVKDMGYTVLMIERQKSAPWGMAAFTEYLEENPYPVYEIAPSFQTRHEMRALNRQCGQFLVGSDQIFNPYLYANWGKFFLLDWVQDSKKKIAYAASFGNANAGKYDESLRTEIGYFINRFDDFSVRESDAVTLCRDVFGREAAHVLDPVFLCPDRYYAELAAKAPIANPPDARFVYAYFLDGGEDKQKILEDVCRETGLRYRLYSDMGIGSSFYLEMLNEKINGRLRDMRDCQFVVTDSFHGVCFALIFRKPFIVWSSPERAYSRFVSLLNDAGIPERLVHNWNEYQRRKGDLLQPMDYDKVYEHLQPLIDKSRSWLENSLRCIKIKQISDYDMAIHISDALEKKLEHKLEELETGFNEKLAAMEQKYEQELRIARLGPLGEFQRIDSFIPYLRAARRHQERIAVIMAAADTPAGSLDENARQALRDLGLTINLNDIFRQGYLAVIEGGEIRIEEAGQNGKSIAESLKVGVISVSLRSSPYEDGNRAEIIVDGENRAVNGRGLNIVILDRNSGAIADSICFDTFLAEIPASRLN